MEHILEKEKMDSMKALADTNIKISEAKESLMKIKSLETSYLSEREKKAFELIEKIVKDSGGILKEAKGNYEQVIALYNTVSEFSAFLKEAYNNFKQLLESFDKQNTLWTTDLKAKEEHLNQLAQEIKTDKVRIKNDQDSLNRAQIALTNDRRKIDLDRQTLDRNIIRLKEGKI